MWQRRRHQARGSSIERVRPVAGLDRRELLLSVPTLSRDVRGEPALKA
jgi:hypothetical protein